MKNRELYYDRIVINDNLYLKINEDDNEFVNLYKHNKLMEKFKLNRKIYTLFKVIQDYTNDDDYIIVEDTNSKIYGKEIHLYENVYMKVNACHACLTVDFYRKDKDNIQLIYLTKLIYTVHKFFHMMLIPKKLEKNPNYYITNVFKFLDMLEIMKYENNA